MAYARLALLHTLEIQGLGLRVTVTPTKITPVSVGLVYGLLPHSVAGIGVHCNPTSLRVL